MLKWGFITFLASCLCFNCASRAPRVFEPKQLEIKEFDDKVTIEEIEVNPIEPSKSQDHELQVASSAKKDKEKVDKSKPAKKKVQASSVKTASESKVDKAPVTQQKRLREPLIEGQEGFLGRRPIVDPFRVNEKVVYDVTYMGMTAGQMSLEVLPMLQVNARKHYHFKGKIWTTPMFSRVYSVQDSISSMVDYESLLPTVYKLQVTESSQVKESRFYIDWKTLQAFFWEKKVTDKEGEQQKQYEWKVDPFSQDVFSSLFYLRVFPWDIGVERAFPVADNQQNVIYRGRVLRKEQIKIPAGTFNTVVIEPKIELQGKFKPSGEIYIWLSDDDRKLILKIQAKVAIGSLTAEAIEVVK